MITDGRVLLTNDEVTDFQTEVNLILSTMNYEFLMYTAHSEWACGFVNYCLNHITLSFPTLHNPLSSPLPSLSLPPSLSLSLVHPLPPLTSPSPLTFSPLTFSPLPLYLHSSCY